MVGAWPSSQALESYNNGVKAYKVTGLRAPFDQIFETTLPEILYLDSKALCGPIHRAAAKNLIPSELIETALKYKVVDFKVVGDVQATPEFLVFYFNCHGTTRAVTTSRINDYVRSVDTVNVNTGNLTFEGFVEKYCSLHRVKYDCTLDLRPGQELPGEWLCDCKMFWMKVVCSHVLKVKSYLGHIDLAKAAEALPKNKKKGPQPASRGALHIENEAPAGGRGGGRRGRGRRGGRGGRGRG